MLKPDFAGCFKADNLEGGDASGLDLSKNKTAMEIGLD